MVSPGCGRPAKTIKTYTSYQCIPFPVCCFFLTPDSASMTFKKNIKKKRKVSLRASFIASVPSSEWKSNYISTKQPYTDPHIFLIHYLWTFSLVEDEFSNGWEMIYAISGHSEGTFMVCSLSTLKQGLKIGESLHCPSWTLWRVSKIGYGMYLHNLLNNIYFNKRELIETF